MDITPKRYLSCLVLLVVTAIASVVSAGQRSGKPERSEAGQYQDKLRDEAFVREGAAVFRTSCSSSYCHGPAGMGGGAPRLRGRDLEVSYVFRTVSNGIPGTPMIAFKSDLTEEQRWKVVSFILSPVAPTATPAESTSSAASSTAATPDASAKSRSASGLSEGDPVKGRELFYDLANQRSCHGCHSINGVGGKVGPDLGAVASSRSSAELAASVLKPHIVDDSKYTTVTLTLADGDKIVGIRKEEAGDVLSVYDTTVLPAVLRTVPKSEIVRIETSPRSIMPADYASVYTERQLADIVAFIKSASARTERER